MRRRGFLLALAATGLSTLGLSACGFQPRGRVELPPALQRISLGGRQPDRGLATALARLLRQSGGQLIDNPREATMRLTIVDYRAGRREVVIDPRARLREVELTQWLKLKAEDAQGNIVLQDEVFETARMMHYDPANLLGHGEEESRLRAEMQEIVAQSILARLRQRTMVKTD